MMKGLVIKNTGSWYQVQSENNLLFDCKIKGNLRLKELKSTNPIAVGDHVRFTLASDGTGQIASIDERKNYIVRKSSNLSRHTHILAANLDMVALIVTINYPVTSPIFIDRFLITAAAYSVPACIVINKMDLYNEEELAYAEALCHLYESLHYPVLKISALKNDGVEPMKTFLKDKVTLLSGNSGVGKSTLLNLLLNNSIAKTSKISDYHNKGTHTTTFSQMYSLENGGNIIDTPGIKGFGTVDMQLNEVSHYFTEIFSKASECKFANCTHIHEPDCAVIDAIEKQNIHPSRYQSYRSILADIDAGKYR